MPRPYVSPLGIGRAAVGAILAIAALLACFAVPAYRPGVWGVAIFLVVAVVYFLVYSSKRLVAQAPEEEVALMAEAQAEPVH